ncbi:transposase family protein [Saccharothrix sp. ALI-22-I]|uniref:transposase family protein n=1 Tax=Saccharothrix sp. ALI-22-I TaxID=1933778 RepID=UPI001930F92B
MVNDTTRLLGLHGLVVTGVEDGHDGRPVVHLSTADQRARSCPGCEVPARRVKGWVTTGPRDLAVAGRQVTLRWRKRRWLCDQQECGRKTFTEAVDQVPARARADRASASRGGCGGGRRRAHGGAVRS